MAAIELDLVPTASVLSDVVYPVGSEGDTMWVNELPERLPSDHVLLKVFDYSGTQAILTTDGARVWLTFRGTEPQSLSDLAADCRANMVGLDSAARRYHAGFYKAWIAIKAAVLEALDELATDKPLVICGHSLGNALAILAAYELANIGDWDVHRIIGFGGPRVGSKLFVKRYNELLGDRTIRIVRCFDKVPRFYTQRWLGMRHVGNHVYFLDQMGNGTMDPEYLAIFWCRLGVFLWSFGKLLMGKLSEALTGLHHHSMKKYRELVHKNLRHGVAS